MAERKFVCLFVRRFDAVPPLPKELTATRELSRVLPRRTVDRHGRPNSIIHFLVYSLTIVVHLASFLLAIVSKNVHFSHHCVSRVSS